MATSYEYQTRKNANLSDTEVLAEAHERVEAFLELLRQERVCNDMLDAGDLPASKASLEASFRLVIATEPRAQVRKRLSSAGLTLAQFQPGLGTRMSIRPAQPPTSRAERPFSRDFGQFDSALSRMAADVERLRQIFAEAESIALRYFDPLKMGPPFREDGTYTWHGHH